MPVDTSADVEELTQRLVGGFDVDDDAALPVAQRARLMVDQGDWEPARDLPDALVDRLRDAPPAHDTVADRWAWFVKQKAALGDFEPGRYL